MICSLVQFDVWHTVCAIESTEQLQCGAEAASEMQQKIGRLKHSWSHDDAGGAELGGASANVDDGDHGGIYNCKYLPVQCRLLYIHLLLGCLMSPLIFLHIYRHSCLCRPC